MPTDLTVDLLSPVQLSHLRRCIALAAAALDDGDEPFGSVLADPKGQVRFEDRNRVKGGDATRHPEFAIARWAAEQLSPAERAASTVYTSGEHCAMCSAAHAWVGLGPIMYAASTEQLTHWLRAWGIEPGPVRPLAIHDVAPGVEVIGPVTELAEEVRRLQARRFGLDPEAR